MSSYPDPQQQPAPYAPYGASATSSSSVSSSVPPIHPHPPLAPAGSTHSEEYVAADLDVLKKQHESKDIEPDSDTVLAIKNVVRLCAEAFWVVYGSMLTVFVPQTCTGADNNNSNDQAHECGFEENFTYLTQLNKFCLGWNFIALFFTVVHYYIMWKREQFFTKFLDYSLTHSRIYLRDTIQQQPALHAQLRRHNARMFYHACWLVVVQGVNYVTSAILIFGFYNSGYKSQTTLLSNLFLVGSVLFRSLDNGWIGMKHDLAFSSFTLEPYSYNVIGLDHRA